MRCVYGHVATCTSTCPKARAIPVGCIKRKGPVNNTHDQGVTQGDGARGAGG